MIKKWIIFFLLNNEQKEKSGISDAMIRLSIGLENHKDIVEDLRGALEI